MLKEQNSDQRKGEKVNGSRIKSFVEKINQWLIGKITQGAAELILLLTYMQTANLSGREIKNIKT